jgi:long-chain fatty acid transport protein
MVPFSGCGAAVRLVAFVLLASGCAPSATAGGFYSPYQTATAIGTAFAGASVRSDNPGFFLFNPALAASFSARETYFDIRGFAPQAAISVSRATSAFGTPLADGGPSGNLATNALAPGAVTMIPLAPGLTLGFGGSTPFATAVKTRPYWAGRFQLQEARMVGLRQNVALGWQASPWLAFGVGVQVERLETRFFNSALIPVGPGAAVETSIRMKGESWRVGAIAGLVITPVDGTRIGLSWRSGMPHRVSGNIVASLPGIQPELVRYTVRLPQVATLGLEQKFGEGLRLFGEAQWIDWSQFKGFRISFPSGRPDEIRQIRWRDTYLLAAGLGYKVQPATEITGGVSLETAASINSSGTTLSTDARQMTFGLGLSHQITHWGTLSLSYARVVVDPAKVKAQSLASGTLEGKLNARLNVVGLGFSARW